MLSSAEKIETSNRIENDEPREDCRAYTIILGETNSKPSRPTDSSQAAQIDEPLPSPLTISLVSIHPLILGKI